MVDIAVKSGAAWVCHAPGKALADILRPVHASDGEAEFGSCEGEQANWGEPVLLEQTEEGSPCVLTLCCSPSSSAAITRLLVVSEARTMEVYSHMGEYCGTVRGQRDPRIQPEGSDRGPFYRKQLCLEDPSSACEVKLLSLAGRSSVLLCGVTVGLKQLQQLQHCPLPGPGIDMQQVQCLVEEMGANLSPGAQHLMDMVHFQQKNQTGSLGGFLPLLMGSGAFSALTKGANLSPAAICPQPQPADPKPPVAAGEAPPAQNGAMTPDLPVSDTCSLRKEGGGSSSHAQLAEMMSHFLKGRGHEQVGDDLLPVLQSVCGQVTKLRLDDAAAVAEKEQKMRNGSWELDAAMERRLEEMEKRLKEHVDRRLDALEQKLEKALLNVLPQIAMSQGGGGSSAGEAAAAAAAAAAAQQTALAPPMH